ncbi:MAG: hypothetical protein H8E03_00705 [Pelagibacteraceae bacterium]|nr:hypothetical protein [Pelagibacteraceae bacterium]
METLKPGLPSGTLITMMGNYKKPIDQIKPGDVIKVFDMASEDYDGAHFHLNTPTYTKVTNVTKQHVTKMVKIKFSNGTDLITTIGHSLRMQALPCGVLVRDEVITRGCSEVDDEAVEFDRVGGRATSVTDIDYTDQLVKDLGYHFCCNVGLESYSPDRKYTESKYDIDDLRFSNVITKNEWDASQLKLGGIPIVDDSKTLEDIRYDVDGDYDSLVNEAVTVIGFEDIDSEFETYTIDGTELNTTNYFANDILVSTDLGNISDDIEHHNPHTVV